MQQITIYTDGACSGNPGAGGWGAILIYKDYLKEISGAEKETTNNRMELLAVIKALSLLKKEQDVVLYSDSAYVVNAPLPLTLTLEQRRDIAVALVNLGYRKVKRLKTKIDKSTFT